MRGLLQVGVSALALLAAGEARAQYVCANCTTELTEVLREVNRAGQVVKQIETAKDQLTQLQNVYASVAHLPDDVLNQIGQQLNVQQLRNALPTADGAIGSVLNGTGLGNLGGLGQQYLDQNRIYTPPAGDYNAAALASNANSIAGVQAMAQQLYQSTTLRIATLQGLEDQVASAPDAKAVADISARVQLENSYIAAQQVQAQAILAAQGAQVRNTEQQRQETRRCYIDEVLAQDDAGNEGDASGSSCNRPSGSTPGYGAGATGGGATSGGPSADGVTPAASSQGFVASGYEQYLGQSVGSGQCVALVQATDPDVGHTSTWTQGAQVMGNTDLKPGTAIATFDSSGRYANATDGSSHAAIYLGQNERGIQVQDQWLNHATSVRTIPWSNTTGASNTGSKFYVVSHGA